MPARYAVSADAFRALSQTLREVQDDLDRPWSLDSMARRAGYDAFHFAHAVRAITGRPPLLWLRELRLERAAHDLVFSPEKPLTAVAREAGYASGEVFRRAFVRAFRVAPSVVRSRSASSCSGAPEDSHVVSQGSGAVRMEDPVVQAAGPLPPGLLEAPEIVRCGPVRAASLRAASFDAAAIGAAWRTMRELVPTAPPFGFGAATPPWGFVVPSPRREYLCLRFDLPAGASLEPPLRAWQADGGWHLRARYHGPTDGLFGLMDWLFAVHLTAVSLRWRFAPVITRFDDRVWNTTAFRESRCDVFVPVKPLGGAPSAPAETR